MLTSLFGTAEFSVIVAKGHTIKPSSLWQVLSTIYTGMAREYLASWRSALQRTTEARIFVWRTCKVWCFTILVHPYLLQRMRNSPPYCRNFFHTYTYRNNCPFNGISMGPRLPSSEGIPNICEANKTFEVVIKQIVWRKDIKTTWCYLFTRLPDPFSFRQGCPGKSLHGWRFTRPQERQDAMRRKVALKITRRHCWKLATGFAQTSPPDLLFKASDGSRHVGGKKNWSKKIHGGHFDPSRRPTIVAAIKAGVQINRLPWAARKPELRKTSGGSSCFEACSQQCQSSLVLSSCIVAAPFPNPKAKRILMCISTKIRCGSKSGNLIALILQPLLLRNSKCFVFVCFPSPKLSHCSCQPVRLPSTCVPCNREGNGHESGGNDAIVTTEVGLASSALFTCSLLRQCWRDSSQAAQKNKLLTTLNGLGTDFKASRARKFTACECSAIRCKYDSADDPWRSMKIAGPWFFVLIFLSVSLLCACQCGNSQSLHKSFMAVLMLGWLAQFLLHSRLFSFFLLWKIEAQLFCKKGVAKLDILAF